MNNKTRVNVMVVGAGMYTIGKNTEGYGTIVPSLFKASKYGIVDKIYIVANTAESIKLAKKKIDELSKIMNVYPDIYFIPNKCNNNYLDVLKDDNDIDAAFIAVPDSIHYQVAKECLEQKKHIWIVKPLVNETSQIINLIDISKKYNLYTFVDYHKRFDLANIKLRDLYFSGAFGDLKHINIHYSQKKVIPEKHFFSWVNTTNIFQYLGVHYVDLIHYFTQAIPLRVLSIGSNGYLSSIGIKTYDTIETLIEWVENNNNKFISSHYSGWIDSNRSSAMSDQRIEVIGTNMQYKSDQKDRGVTIQNSLGEEKLNPYFNQFYSNIDQGHMEVKGYGPESIIQFIQDVSDIKNKLTSTEKLKGARPTFETSFYTTKVLEASNQSLKNNNYWINI